MRGISILGSTGSIGTQTVEIARLFPDRFRVVALAAGSNADLLAEQALAVRPSCVYIASTEQAEGLRQALAGSGIEVLVGEEGLERVAAHPQADVVVAAMVGFAGLRPVLAAIGAGKTVALANKETLVVAGHLVNRLLREHGARLIPVDSEHSAIFQCLVGEPVEAVERILLTASGGPFRERPASTFESITRAEALDHPNWSMGAKITIDSATMMNKGLEVIEAHWMFGLDADRIDVLVHPQSIIHSMVCFTDGSVKAQLGAPDMRVPIQYALTYPDRWPAPHPRVDWHALARLDFEPPDFDKFRCLRLAYDALRAGRAAPAVLNAANEAAVAAFLEDRIAFARIPALIEHALERADDASADDLEGLVRADTAARRAVAEELKRAAEN